ncbi:hypothetical protein HN865_02725 [Candidatus Woesearchaeota archaeon]|nr:hypothetical protein [Candidatus Woesearchaeota archaeon]MBT7237750.1 hypothetical protein [Candidatus Woesearchaeota archaeon]
MNKRGQFYLIIVLILSLAIFGITYQVNSISEAVVWEDFNEVSQNYLSESTRVANNAVKNKEDVTTKLETFSTSFLEYAQKRNPDLGLLFVYGDENEITVRNYLDSSGTISGETIFGSNQEFVQDVTVRVGGKDFVYKVPITSKNFGDDWSGLTISNNPFNLSIAGIFHPFDLTSGNPEFKVILRTETRLLNETYGSGEWNPSLSPNVQQFTN